MTQATWTHDTAAAVAPEASPRWLHRLFPTYAPLAPAVREALDEDFLAADHFFFRLMLLHWAAATLLVSLSHGAWLLGLVGGGAIAGLSFVATRIYAGTPFARAINGACLMLFSALFIQQQAGRLEMHFHVFAAISMLIRYRDLLPTLTAALTIAVHHLAFNYCQQYGVAVLGAPVKIFDYGTGLDIVLLHATFVVLGVFVNERIIGSFVRQFITATELASSMSTIASAREADRAEIEAARRAEHDQTQALQSKVDRLLVAVNEAAAGDLTARTLVTGQDAIGRVGEGLGGMLQDLRGRMSTIASHAESLAKAASALSEVSTELEANARTSGDHVHSAQERASSVRQAVRDVAKSAEQLQTSMRQVGEHADRAFRVTEDAAGLIDRSGAIMTELQLAGRAIGDVIKTISDIAARTNLLALNATIEAASAGDAGRGFAVVASEVKTLAVSTAQATERVGEQVRAIQGRTQEAAAAMTDVQRVIGEIRGASQAIASAVDEQRAAAGHIQASVAEAADESQRIFDAVAELDATASRTSSGAAQTRGSAGQLVQVAHDLRAQVDRFRTA